MLNSKNKSLMFLQKNKQEQKGISILFAVLILSIILSISLGISSISLEQTKMMEEAGYSVIAFYAADTGIEEGLFMVHKKTPAFTESSYLDLDGDGSQDLEEPTYTINAMLPDGECEGVSFCIKSIGIYKGMRRAIQRAIKVVI